jgi:hypothetical protein
MKPKTIAIVFTILLLVQSSYFLPFSLKEGFSTMTLIAIGVSIAPIIMLWAIFFMLRRVRHGLWIQLLSGIIICIVFEALLPVSPFKTTLNSMRIKKAVDSVKISGVTDDFYYSLLGNPVGIRISFNAAFLHGGFLSVSPAIRAIDDRLHHYMTSMNHFANITIKPQPEKDPERGDFFVGGQSYRFTADFLPSFLFTSRHGEELCLYDKGVDEFKKIVTDPIKTKYSVEIHVDGNSYFVNRRIACSGSTQKDYTLNTFYESALSQRVKPCDF